MLIKPGKSYKLRVGAGPSSLTKTFIVRDLYHRTYTYGGKIVDQDFVMTTTDGDSYIIPAHNIAMYEKGTSPSILNYIALEDTNCGLFTIFSSRCEHDWALTGMKWTFCKRCEIKGWNHMGEISVDE